MSGKILLVSPFFYPEQISTGRYNTYFVKALVDAGFLVDVIASHPLYPNWRPEPCSWQISGVQIFRGGGKLRYPKHPVLRRLLLEIWFAYHVLRTCFSEPGKYEIALFIFPPILFAILPRWVFKSKYRVVIIHDLQSIMATASRGLIRSLIGRGMQCLEKSVLQRCDWLICLSSSMKKVLVDRYKIAASKVSVNYPFPSIVDGSTKDLAEVFESELVHVVYSGGLGEKQLPEFVLSVFKRLCEIDDRIVCHFFSGGPCFEMLKSEIAKQQIMRIRFHDLVPEENLMELYRRSTVQLIPQATGTGAGAFPSKLPNLLVAGVAVFAICDHDSELAQFVLDSECGRCNVGWGADSIAHEIIDFIKSLETQDSCVRQIKANRFIREQCDIFPLIERLIALRGS